MCEKKLTYEDAADRKIKLTQKAIKFFDLYKEEIELLRQLVDIKLNHIALAYTQKNNLPSESVKITTRVKSLKSFLKKLERNNWKDFNFLTEIAQDLIGARIVCWFLNDCYGLFDYIKSSKQFKVKESSIKDYIAHPKSSGYRSIHLQTDVDYDRLNTKKSKDLLSTNTIVCEIQIRTKIQDVFGDLTQSFITRKDKSLANHSKKLRKF